MIIHAAASVVATSFSWAPKGSASIAQHFVDFSFVVILVNAFDLVTFHKSMKKF
jgi:hypothetical protein